MKPTTKRQLVTNTILAVAVSFLAVVSVLTSVVDLIFRPDRPTWQIVLDFVIIALFALFAVIVAVCIRSVLADVEDESERIADRREAKAESYRTKQENGGW